MAVLQTSNCKHLTGHNPLIRRGLVLETTSFSIPHGMDGGQSFQKTFDKTIFVFHYPTEAAPKFL